MAQCMRMTLTFDDDVAVEIERLRQDGGQSLNEVVNDLLRLGLRERHATQKKQGSFRTKTFDVGRPLIPSIDNAADVVSLIEGDAHK